MLRIFIIKTLWDEILNTSPLGFMTISRLGDIRCMKIPRRVECPMIHKIYELRKQVSIMASVEEIRKVQGVAQQSNSSSSSSAIPLLAKQSQKEVVVRKRTE